jgi:ADP-ribosylglycohydrolase
VFMARNGETKSAIRAEIIGRFGYDLHRSLYSIRPDYRFNISCQGSVPEAIIAFLESSSYVDAVKNAISLGGDADTMACIAGGIAQAYYRQIPETIVEKALEKLTPDLRQVVERFARTYSCPF